MFVPTFAARERNHITPLVRWAGSIVRRLAPKADSILDYRPNSFSILGHKEFPALKKYYFHKPLYIKPTGETTEIKSLSNRFFDVVVAFDDMDREASVSDFLFKLSAVQKKGALLFLTANTASGFEYQILGEHSPRLVIPDRINLLTVEAIKERLTVVGYKVLDISTPNKFDVSFVKDEILRNRSIEVSDFLRYLFENRDDTVLQSLQDFLQLNHLASYCRIAAQKVA